MVQIVKQQSQKIDVLSSQKQLMFKQINEKKYWKLRDILYPVFLLSIIKNE